MADLGTENGIGIRYCESKSNINQAVRCFMVCSHSQCVVWHFPKSDVVSPIILPKIHGTGNSKLVSAQVWRTGFLLLYIPTDLSVVRQ